MELTEHDLEASADAYRRTGESYFNMEYAKNLGTEELSQTYEKAMYAASGNCIIPNPERSQPWQAGLARGGRPEAIEAVIQESHKNPKRWKAPKDFIWNRPNT